MGRDPTLRHGLLERAPALCCGPKTSRKLTDLLRVRLWAVYRPKCIQEFLLLQDMHYRERLLWDLRQLLDLTQNGRSQLEGWDTATWLNNRSQVHTLWTRYWKFRAGTETLKTMRRKENCSPKNHICCCRSVSLPLGQSHNECVCICYV